MWRIGDQLHYAQVISRIDRPPTARVLTGTYRGKGKQPNTHRLKCDHAKYPLRVEGIYLSQSPQIARALLMARIADTVNKHENTIEQLWAALAESDRTAGVVWPGKKNVRRKELQMPGKTTAINTLANLQNLRTMQASRDSLQARLIAAHQRTRSKNPSSGQNIASADVRKPDAELPAEIPPLNLLPEEAIPSAAPPHEPPPINPTHSGPIPPTSHETNIGGKPPRRFKPGQSSK